MLDKAVTILNKDFLSLSMGISERNILHEIFTEYMVNLKEVILVLGEENIHPDRLYVYAHKMKSSSAAVGAMWLSEKFAEIDATIHEGNDCLLLLPDLCAACRKTMEAVADHLKSFSL
jgi:hypothetical protein